VTAAIVGAVHRIFLNDPGTRLGDEEALHQMRVGARRLRSDLRTFSKLVDKTWSDGLRSELKWLGRALGDVRDLDVMQERLRTDASDLAGIDPLFESLNERHAVARQKLLEVLRSERYLRLLETLISAARSPTLSARAWEQSHTVFPPLAERAWRKLAKEARALGPTDPDHRFHAVRILAKRSRYAAEAVAPALGTQRAKEGARFAKRVARLQDVLGVLQDATVAREAIQEIVARHPADAPFALAAGRLIERQELAARAVRKRFAKAWRRLDRKKLPAWMDA
jgi:CHAD domain-containing protein